MNKRIILSALIIGNALYAAKGFVPGTEIMTSTGKTTIENIKPQDKILSYSKKFKCPMEDVVISVIKQKVKEVIEIQTENDTIQVDPKHKFFTSKHKWVKAKDLLEDFDVLSSILRDSKIIKTGYVKKETPLYCLQVKNNHNFFIGKDAVLVHNAIPLVIVGAWATFKAGAAAFAAYTAANTTVSVSVSVGGVAIFGVLQNLFNRNRHEPTMEITPTHYGSGVEYKKITNKEADENADRIGAVRVKSVRSQDRPHAPVYKAPDGTLITPDDSSHKGGIWKEVDRKGKRLRTLDKDLNPISKRSGCEIQ